jgi:hypothetical protein
MRTSYSRHANAGQRSGTKQSSGNSLHQLDFYLLFEAFEFRGIQESLEWQAEPVQLHLFNSFESRTLHSVLRTTRYRDFACGVSVLLRLLSAPSSASGVRQDSRRSRSRLLHSIPHGSPPSGIPITRRAPDHNCSVSLSPYLTLADHSLAT